MLHSHGHDAGGSVVGDCPHLPSNPPRPPSNSPRSTTRIFSRRRFFYASGMAIVSFAAWIELREVAWSSQQPTHEKAAASPSSPMSIVGDILRKRAAAIRSIDAGMPKDHVEITHEKAADSPPSSARAIVDEMPRERAAAAAADAKTTTATMPKDDVEIDGPLAVAAAIAPATAPKTTAPPAALEGVSSSIEEGTSTAARGSPQWFETSHPQYQTFVAANAKVGQTVNPWHLATLFCYSLSLSLCGYESYCPEGKGKEPYGGGPPGLTNSSVTADDDGDPASGTATMWAPVMTMALQRGEGWVIVRRSRESDGGADDARQGTCWTYRDWADGSKWDATEEVAEENRRWMLCCPAR